jgi:molybdopterin-guanine dinucleotide biosynthesis protein A
VRFCHHVGVDDVSGAILAGGRSRRFGGQDKSRLLIEGRAIIVRQIDVLARVAGEVFIVGGPPERFADLGVPVHADLVAGTGALGGVHTALEAARAEHVIVVACDIPFLSAELLAELVRRSRDADGAWIRTAHGVEPLLACYRRSARHVVEREVQAGRLKAADLGTALHIIELGTADVERFGPIERLLANINTPDDYARIQ